MPNITLNAIVAEAFDEAANELEGSADFEKRRLTNTSQRQCVNIRESYLMEMVIRMNGLKKLQNVVFLTLNQWWSRQKLLYQINPLHFSLSTELWIR